MDINNEKITVPIIIGFVRPFRIIKRDNNDNWNPSLEQINNNSYDYVKLSRISAYIDGNIASYAVGLGFDGSLVLPAIKDYANQSIAINIFNRILTEALLGGIYTETIMPEDITLGNMQLFGYYRPITTFGGAAANFHRAIREQCPSPLDAIQLLQPINILVSEFNTAISKGRKLIKEIFSLSPNILLTGVTYYVKHQWAEALVNIWTVIEQIISHIWDNKIVIDSRNIEEIIPGRKSFLSDFRTWTTSTRIEVIYQKNLITPEVYIKLNEARKSRNKFVHEGDSPLRENVSKGLDALLNLISLVASNFTDIDILKHPRNLIENYMLDDLSSSKKSSIDITKVQYWRKIAPLPGDQDWKGPYETFEDLQLKPISDFKTT